MMALQMPSSEKRARSDFVIENDGDHCALERRAARSGDALEARA